VDPFDRLAAEEVGNLLILIGRRGFLYCIVAAGEHNGHALFKKND